MSTAKAPVVHYGVTEMKPSGDHVDLHTEEIDVYKRQICTSSRKVKARYFRSKILVFRRTSR